MKYLSCIAGEQKLEIYSVTLRPYRVLSQDWQSCPVVFLWVYDEKKFLLISFSEQQQVPAIALVVKRASAELLGPTPGSPSQGQLEGSGVSRLQRPPSVSIQLKQPDPTSKVPTNTNSNVTPAIPTDQQSLEPNLGPNGSAGLATNSFISVCHV